MLENKLPKSLEHLKKLDIILASSSPRRMEILAKLNIEFRVMPSRFPETLAHSDFKTPEDYVTENAKQKAAEVYQRLESEGALNEKMLIISADTIVVLEESYGSWRILEKPANPTEATEMLRKLSGRPHKVMTAVHFLWCSSNQTFQDSCFCEVSTVYFDDLTDDVIQWYVETGEPFDKAGGYGYQSLGMILVKRIEGCYYNVIGFPIQRISTELQKLKLYFD